LQSLHIRSSVSGIADNAWTGHVVMQKTMK
jgi:hypothetical protein